LNNEIIDTSVSRSEEDMEEMEGDNGGGAKSVAGSNIVVLWICNFVVCVREVDFGSFRGKGLVVCSVVEPDKNFGVAAIKIN
jgi:hypothetical protein